MARIFITGSVDGLGYLSAESLIKQGHTVILHARNKKRGQAALEALPKAKGIVFGDLSDTEETIRLAGQVNESGPFEAIIHNAGVLQASAQNIFHVNVLAPYILTCLIEKPKRLIYLSSKLHLQGHSKLANLKTNISEINYADSKLQVLMLAKAVARKWPEVYSNAVHPGWVPTKLGGQGAPDDLQKGYETQAWLAVSNDEETRVSGHYFFHKKEIPGNPEADNVHLQDELLDVCGEITGVPFHK